MNRFKIVNLAILGTIFILLHFEVEADCRSSCSLPGLPGRDGVAGQPGRDGRDGVPGPAGSPGGQLHECLHDKCDTPTITTACCMYRLMADSHMQLGNPILPLQPLELMEQQALLARLVNRALLDPVAHQEPLAHQGEQLTSAGGGLCAQMLLELS